MKENITVPTGKVVGIGKIKVFTTEDFPFVIPTLSFLVARSEDGSYTASCLHLLLDSSASNDRDAVDRLQENCKDFLKDLFCCDMDKQAVWAELHELINSKCAYPYWEAYRDVQYNLAEKGVDLKFEREKFYEERIHELEAQIETMRNIRAPMEVHVVSYQSYEACESEVAA